MKRPEIYLDSICLDCDDRDLERMVTFYSKLLGYPAAPLDGDSPAMVQGPALAISFQPVIGYHPPTWPSEVRGQQMHLDLLVKDLDESVAYARSIGAREPPAQFGYTWMVMLDPAGHPFCLTQDALFDGHRHG